MYRLGRMKSQGISRSGQSVLARLTESQIWHWPASAAALWVLVSERGNGLYLPFCLKENCPPALALMPDSSLPHNMPLVPFKQLPWFWSSERVNLSKSMCEFFKGNWLRLQQFLPPTQSPLVFVAKSYEVLSSWHLNPGLWGLVWGWDSLLLRYPSQIFIHHTWMWNQPILLLCPSYQSEWMWFL